MNDEDEGAKSNDSEPEMFDNVMETSVRPQIIDSDSDASETPIKKPPPPKRKLGPKPAATNTKRKIMSSDSEASPVKKKVKSIKMMS